MTKKKITFKNSYNTVGHKPEFGIKYKAEDMTDQSQHASASISEMAKKYGIEALMSKANKQYVDSIALQDQFFGHDFTQMQQSKEDLLNVKKKVTNLFNNIPAAIRKTVFNDNIQNFLDTYTSNDVNKITALRNIGLVSDTQLNAVVNYNNKLKEEKLNNQKRKEFIAALEAQQGALYENFKNTGNIIINNNKDTATGNTVLQDNI